MAGLRRAPEPVTVACMRSPLCLLSAPCGRYSVQSPLIVQATQRVGIHTPHGNLKHVNNSEAASTSCVVVPFNAHLCQNPCPPALHPAQWEFCVHSRGEPQTSHAGAYICKQVAQLLIPKANNESAIAFS